MLSQEHYGNIEQDFFSYTMLSGASFNLCNVVKQVLS